MEKIDTEKTVLYRLLAERFGAREFRPLQYQVIQDVLRGGTG
jgi:hypothetical protein